MATPQIKLWSNSVKGFTVNVTHFSKMVVNDLRSVANDERKDIMGYQTDTSMQECEDKQMLFMIKPELFDEGVDTPVVIEEALRKVIDNSYEIESLTLMGGAYIKENIPIEKHFAVVAPIFFRGVDALSPKALYKLDKITGPIDETRTVGGGQMIKETGIGVEELADAWEGRMIEDSIKKLDHAMYMADIEYKGEIFHVLNGFYAFQILKYHRDEARVVLLGLRSSEQSTGWKRMRKYFLGDTDPAADFPICSNSLRRWLYDNKAHLGINKIDRIFNGFHLSDGPLSALHEILIWYPFLNPMDLAMSNLMMDKGISLNLIKKILKNPYAHYDNKYEQIFYQSAGMDPLDVIDMLIEIKGQIQ